MEFIYCLCVLTASCTCGLLDMLMKTIQVVIFKAKVALKVYWQSRVLQVIVSDFKEWVDHFLVQAFIQGVLHL